MQTKDWAFSPQRFSDALASTSFSLSHALMGNSIIHTCMKRDFGFITITTVGSIHPERLATFLILFKGKSAESD